MRECVLKYDHFENIHRLGKDAKVTIEGAPNVRQVWNFGNCNGLDYGGYLGNNLTLMIAFRHVAIQ